MLTLKVKRIGSRSKLPTKAYPEDAGWDFYAVDDQTIFSTQTARVALGVAVEIPPGYCLVLKDRSSMANKAVFSLGGVIDSSYRGELTQIIQNMNCCAHQIKAGDKVCQGLLLPVPEVEVVEVQELSPTPRGEKGFGSSGR